MVTQEIHNKVVSEVNRYVETAKNLWPHLVSRMGVINVGWERRKVGVAGLAYRGQNRVTFNSDFIEHDDFWETTIPHEVAHIVQRWVYPNAKQAHGPEFRRIMSLFGKNGRTYHSMITDRMKEKKPFEYVCPSCNKSFFMSDLVHRRIQSGQRRFCVEKRCQIIQKRKSVEAGNLRHFGGTDLGQIVLKGTENKSKEVLTTEILKDNLITSSEKVETVQPPKPQPTIRKAVTLKELFGV